MRYLVQSKAFRRDLKREARGRYGPIVKEELWEVANILANDEPLARSYHDHPLLGNWLGSRECHLAFDFVLVYTLEGDDKLILERLGTHTETLGL